MSRRELFIVLVVVVPFLGLVAAGLAWRNAPETPPPLPTEPPRMATPPEPTPPEPTPTVALEPTPTRVELFDAGADELPRTLEAPLRAVGPEIIRCFDDQRAHLSGLQRLTIAFTPKRDGGFADVRVPTGGNPYLAACVEDVFDEVHFTPTGLETFQPATHTFVFDPSRE